MVLSFTHQLLYYLHCATCSRAPRTHANRPVLPALVLLALVLPALVLPALVLPCIMSSPITLTLEEAKALGLLLEKSKEKMSESRTTAFRALLNAVGILLTSTGLIGTIEDSGYGDALYFTIPSLQEKIDSMGIKMNAKTAMQHWLFLWRGIAGISPYLMLKKMTKYGPTYNVVKFDSFADYETRLTYKGIVAIAGPEMLLASGVGDLKSLSRCASKEVLGCSNFVSDGGLLCSTCYRTALIQLIPELVASGEDFKVYTTDVLQVLGLPTNGVEKELYLEGTENTLFESSRTFLSNFFGNPIQRENNQTLISYFALLMENRDSKVTIEGSTEQPLDGVETLEDLLTKHDLMPSGGMIEAARRVSNECSYEVNTILELFGWNTDLHGECPDMVYGANYGLCPNGHTSEIVGGCAAILCNVPGCKIAFCRFCGGSAINEEMKQGQSRCSCGQFFGDGACYVENRQYQEAVRIERMRTGSSAHMEVVVPNNFMKKRIRSYVKFLRRAHRSATIPDPFPEPPAPPIPPLPAVAPPSLL